MPNLYRLPKFLFPQIEAYSNGIKREFYNFFPFKDKFIDKCYKDKSIEEISSIVRDESLILHNLINDEFVEFIDKVRDRELEWDIKIADFLIENISKAQLFYDPGHPTPLVINYIAKGILSRVFDEKITIDNITDFYLDVHEVPVYSAVSAALKFEWNKSVYRKHGSVNTLKLNDKPLDLNEYIRQYINWNFYSTRND